MDELPMLGLRQFRLKLTKVDEPTRVVTTRQNVRVLGTWIPAGYRVEGDIVKVEGSEEDDDGSARDAP